MKKNPSSSPRSSAAFTLVELLVVIVIIGALAALAFTMGPKMLKRGDGAKSLQNMRQIGALLGTYASDNSFTLPPPRGATKNENGSYDETHWFQALLLMAYPDMSVPQMNLKWYQDNKIFMHNPLFTIDYGKNYPGDPNHWENWNPGYGINMAIKENLGKANTGAWTPGGVPPGPEVQGVNLTEVSEPARTPIVAPNNNWMFWYRDDDLKKKYLTGFLIEGKMPILFVDGHVETMPLSEYKNRQLTKMPFKPGT
jgi:general secretion pathway protein G